MRRRAATQAPQQLEQDQHHKKHTDSGTIDNQHSAHGVGGACTSCKNRDGPLGKCRHCNKSVHYFCARLWFAPADGLLACSMCQTSPQTRIMPEQLEQASLETRFADDYLAVCGLERRAADRDGLCFFASVAVQVDEDVATVAQRLLRQRRRSRPSSKRADLKTQWHSDTTDLLPRCAFPVFKRMPQMLKPSCRQMVVLWVPDDQQGHIDPIRVCRSGTSVPGQEHYEVARKTEMQL